jgi:hypothetical protein
MPDKCASCGRKKGMRDCPALGTRICPACCGTKRGKEISCPSGCEIPGGIEEQRLAGELETPSGEDDLFDVRASRIGNEAEEAAILYHIRTGKCPFTDGECSPDVCPRGGMAYCPIHGGEAAG